MDERLAKILTVFFILVVAWGVLMGTLVLIGHYHGRREPTCTELYEPSIYGPDACMTEDDYPDEGGQE